MQRWTKAQELRNGPNAGGLDEQMSAPTTDMHHLQDLLRLHLGVTGAARGEGAADGSMGRIRFADLRRSRGADP
jgi:hypothetical protein